MRHIAHHLFSKGIIFYVVFLHFSWGVQLLVLGPQGADWHGGVFWNVFLNLGGTTVWAWGMIIASGLSLWALARPDDLRSLVMQIPQQVILSVSAIGIVLHFNGVFYEYADSRLWRVAASTFPAFVFHTLAILGPYVRRDLHHE